MRRIIAMLTIVSLLITGCWDQKIYERTGFILQAGIESGKEKRLLVTLTSPVVGGEIKQQVEIVDVEADILRDARERARMLSPKTLEGGKIQQVLISNELAEKGMGELLDIFHRETALPSQALVVIIDGSPHEMLEAATSFEDKPRAAFYINQLLEGNIKSSYLPETRIWDFSSLNFAPGIDPVTPMLRLQKEGIMSAGSALFYEDKMVGKLAPKDTSLLLAMMGKLKTTEYVTTCPSKKNSEDQEEALAAILIKKAKANITVKIVNSKPIVNINLKLHGNLDEFEGDNINEVESQKAFEQEVSKNIKGECDRIMKYLISVGSDPLGIGDIVRAKYNSYWQSANWKEAYKDVEVDISVMLDIKQFGAVD